MTRPSLSGVAAGAVPVGGMPETMSRALEAGPANDATTQFPAQTAVPAPAAETATERQRLGRIVIATADRGHRTNAGNAGSENDPVRGTIAIKARRDATLVDRVPCGIAAAAALGGIATGSVAGAGRVASGADVAASAAALGGRGVAVLSNGKGAGARVGVRGHATTVEIGCFGLAARARAAAAVGPRLRPWS
jgi:hypothetical protein